MKNTSNMKLWHNSWYVRIVIPKDVRWAFGNRHEYIRSTKKKKNELAEAVSIRDIVVTDFKAQVKFHRTGDNGTVKLLTEQLNRSYKDLIKLKEVTIDESSVAEVLEKSRYFVRCPEALQMVVAQLKEKKQMTAGMLAEPEPDHFSYQMTLHRGFVNYPERIGNYLLNHCEIRKPKRKFIPTILDLEPNSVCNFRCTMCQVSNWKNGKRAKNLTVDELKVLIGDRPLYTEIKLHGMGEPLMHRKYSDMVAWLVEKDIWVRTSINGSLLHVRNNYKRLIDSGIGEIQCSFDGADKAVFEKIRVKSNFDQVVENFGLLNKYANKKKRLYTRMWVLLQQHNRHQLYKFVELAKRMEFRRLTFSLTLNDFGQEEWRKSNKNIEAKGFSPEEELELCRLSDKTNIEITKWYQRGRYSINSRKTMCPWVFNRPYVTSDLRVVPCAVIANPDIIDFGDARELKKVWFGEAYRRFREQHLSGNVPEVCQGCYTNILVDDDRTAQKSIT